VITINESKQAIEAFKLMHEKNVSAIAVVNDEDALVGNISSSDLKTIGSDAKLLSNLFLPIPEFVKLLPGHDHTIAVTPSATFAEVVTKLDSARVHRVYVVDALRPIGVIATIEILSTINALFS